MPDPTASLLAPPPWPARDAAHLLVSSRQMAGLEEQIFASGLPVEALMEKAALAVGRRLLKQHGGLLRQRGALVLVGPGHNGGDGLVIARELHLAGVATAIWSPFERHKPLTAAHLRHCLWLGIPRLQRPPDANGPELWIDALLGIGQERSAGEAIESLLAERQQERPQRLVAVDVPTGLCADSGLPTGNQPACADTTYCIGLLKQGLIQDPALAWVGRLERIELGLPATLLQTLPADQPLALGAEDLATAPRPQPAPQAAKYGRGRLLVLAGSEAYRGAAQLALLGASASGCGSLRAGLPQAVAAGLWVVQPHVVVAANLGRNGQGGRDLAELDLEALGLVAPARSGAGSQRLDALLLGPGIGPGTGPAAAAAAPGGGERQAGEARTWTALQQFPGLLVLDADGLNRLAAGGGAAGADAALQWLQRRAGATWLTPHAGEFARLFPDLADLPPAEAARFAAQRSGAAVLLKGARSVVAAPDGRSWQLLRASPAAARAGLGDVLAGYAAGRGALALAAGWSADGSLLAAAALDHAQAGLAAIGEQGAGGATPMAVAHALAQIDPDQPRESAIPRPFE
ncbi:NAD(P)H-hydrate epimerase [Vulcanococcus limneticus]|uniref:NAD(P)H-hydrate epimerase n=1 Tax=Vulcanococcus limneticus TaxID=2170428 RepID=UPI00398C0480